jgi:hypothetical protein
MPASVPGSVDNSMTCSPRAFAAGRTGESVPWGTITARAFRLLRKKSYSFVW